MFWSGRIFLHTGILSRLGKGQEGADDAFKFAKKAIPRDEPYGFESVVQQDLQAHGTIWGAGRIYIFNSLLTRPLTPISASTDKGRPVP